jgi:hypothetical protein
MAARMHVVLALRLKLKLWENLRWYLQVYKLVSILGFFQKSIRLCHGRKKSFKTSKIYLFLLDFTRKRARALQRDHKKNQFFLKTCCNEKFLPNKCDADHV